MKNWRPEGWENPYPAKLSLICQGTIAEEILSQGNAIYEDGADAMLKALCTKENYIEWEDEQENLSGIQYRHFKGWLVAVPDDNRNSKRKDG